MYKVIIERLKQGYKTNKFPKEVPKLPERFSGRPVIRRNICKNTCMDCENACPTGAITRLNGKPVFNLAKCIFCNDCVNACNEKAIFFTTDHRLAAEKKEQLLLLNDELPAFKASKKIIEIYGRSLKLRQVSAGGCNACEADTNVLSTLAFDLGRFGIQFVASPRHADGLLVTGPVTKNMELALMKTYEALSEPKIVIAVGACSISGGVYSSHNEVIGGVDKLIPVDIFIPGCPPHPLTILDGLLKVIGKI